MQFLDFEPQVLPPQAQALRREVRAFLAEAGVTGAARKSAKSSDPEFSLKVGQRGWLGMTWPKQYGGGERSSLERYIVIEEMLVAQAPVGCHWVADRQSGPQILRHGSEAQKQRFLPAIARGELCFCIGMSEPDAGSDLAAIRSRAERVEGGWRLSGTKLWTSNAHLAHYMIALVRTAKDEDRHGGVSQFIVDMKSPGVSVRPIRNLMGQADFNEVVLQDVLVPDDMLLGREGDGWKLVMGELANERSGPERFLSPVALLLQLCQRIGSSADARDKEAVGRLVAHLVTLRRMSLSVAGTLARHQDPSLQAAIVKDLGADFEQRIPLVAQELANTLPLVAGGDEFERLLGRMTRTAPIFSLRGGTREILRGIIAKGLGLR